MVILIGKTYRISRSIVLFNCSCVISVHIVWLIKVLCFILVVSINPLVYLYFSIYFYLSGAISILLLWSLGCLWTIVPNTARYRPRDVRFFIRSSSITVYAWCRGRLYYLLLLGFMDSGLRSVSNSLSSFGVLFLVGGLVVPLAIGIIGCSSALLLLLIDSCVSIVKSNTSILFVVSCSSSGITSRDNNCIIGISIGLIGRYLDVLDVMLCVIISSIISSWITIVSTSASIESL
jgi:hypothetical protein